MKQIAFVIDANLGRLLKYLRFAGFDCISAQHIGDPAILRLCQKDQRIYLTKNNTIPLLLKKIKTLVIKSNNYLEQINEIKQYIELDPVHFFTRCIQCNKELTTILPKHIELPTHISGDKIKYCSHCKKMFWEGTHYSRMKECLLTH